MNKKALIAELKRREAEAAAKASKPVFSFDKYCFEAQRKFFRDEGPRFRTAVCSRRAGKTVGIVADMVDTCLSEEGVVCLYITLTQQNARNIIWNDLLRVIEEYDLDVKIDNTRLTVVFTEKKSRIVIAGAKDRQEIEKYRGWKLRKCYIDECQSFRPYIKELINDVITPALRDLKGELYLTGTPGPVPAGPFYEYSHSDFWANHKWTAFDNPHMHNPPKLDLEDTLAEEREMKGIDVSDPGYQRETYGRWIEDKDSLVFKFNKAINIYDSLPKIDFYIFGIDIGFEDADAIAVLGYSSEVKQVFLVEENIVRKQDITALVNKVKALDAKYAPVKKVMDAGALGKKIQEEILQRHGVNMEAAEKHRKVEFIELLNDDLRTGKFKAFHGSVFEEDSYLVQWDRESKIKNPERPKILDTYHSDITDAVLYGWRECRHYLSEPAPEAERVGTDAYMDELERREAEKMQRRNDDPYEAALMEEFEQDISDLDDWDF